MTPEASESAMDAPSPLPDASRGHPHALAPVSPDDPCGPDLDLEGDADFLNFTAEWEGALPGKAEAFYDPALRVSRAALDFARAVKQGEALLARTLDVRVLVLLAKLAILDRDLDGFATRVGQTARLIGERWDEAHPRAEGGEYGMRIAQLETLEHNAAVLLPLQYAPFLETPRQGAMTYRDHLIASGAVAPRSVKSFSLTGEKQTTAPEEFMPEKTIGFLVDTVPLDALKAQFDRVSGLAEQVASIRATTGAKAGLQNAVKLEKLAEIIAGMVAFLRTALLKRDPTLAPPEPAPADRGEAQTDEAAAPAGPAPAFASRAEVAAALQAALGYFVAFEPSSPAVLLLRQASDTFGKNLYEVMQLLTPQQADAARVIVGPERAFLVPVKALSQAPTPDPEPVATEPVRTRAEALRLTDAVSTHMQRAEPSSPVPYLIDRARNLATRDFLSLLRDVLPDDALEAIRKAK